MGDRGTVVIPDNRYRRSIILRARGDTLPVSRPKPSRVSRVEEVSVNKEDGIVLPLVNSNC
jgi:hypothetical protein